MKRIRLINIEILALIAILFMLPWAYSRAGEGKAFLLNELCSPLFEGRKVGSKGNHLAAQMLSKRLQAHALTPLEGYTNFLIPFEQGIAVINTTKLTAIMKDGSREALTYGKDYMFVGAACTINGTFPVSVLDEKADSLAVLFFDREASEKMPEPGTFATMIFPVDVLSFGSLGVYETDISDNTPVLPRINMLRTVYHRVSEAVALDIQYDFSKVLNIEHNVVGILPGKDRTKAVVVSAHFDGAGDQAGNRLPCALDNASGIVVVDQVLSQIIETALPYDVIFAFTNGEEARLTGAHDLAGKLVSQYETLYNINVDCVGIPRLPFLMKCPDERFASLYQRMEEYLSGSGFAVIPEAYGSSDHDAFANAGIPSVVLGMSYVDVAHTVNDTAERIDTNILYRIAEMIVDFIVENPDMHDMLSEKHVSVTTLVDMSTLAYNQAIKQDDTLYTGSSRWMTQTEALRYYPTLPLPQEYKGCPMEACMVVLSTVTFPDGDPGQIITLPDEPENIMQIAAIYSDRDISYSFDFYAMNVRDRYVRQKIREEGFLLATRDNEVNVIEGIGLQEGDMSLYLFDGDATDGPNEVEPGVSIHGRNYGTSKVTEENASTFLTDPELMGIFEALIAFVRQ